MELAMVTYDVRCVALAGAIGLVRAYMPRSRVAYRFI